MKLCERGPKFGLLFICGDHCKEICGLKDALLNEVRTCSRLMAIGDLKCCELHQLEIFVRSVSSPSLLNPLSCSGFMQHAKLHALRGQIQATINLPWTCYSCPITQYTSFTSFPFVKVLLIYKYVYRTSVVTMSSLLGQIEGQLVPMCSDLV